jgi:hypothetical protein
MKPLKETLRRRKDVYFDDSRIDYQQGPLLEENHFYPFGLKMAAFSSRAPFAAMSPSIAFGALAMGYLW